MLYCFLREASQKWVQVANSYTASGLWSKLAQLPRSIFGGLHWPPARRCRCLCGVTPLTGITGQGQQHHWAFSGASSRGTFQTLHISIFESPLLSGSMGESAPCWTQTCSTSCPKSYLIVSGTKDQVSFLSVLSVQGLETKMFIWREAFCNHTQGQAQEGGGS